MTQTTAGWLLGEIAKDSIASRDTVAVTAGIGPERAAAAMAGTTHLTLAEQLRLAEAAMLCAPRHKRLARRLRSQVLAARSFDAGDVISSVDAPTAPWERSAMMRR